jgi:ATP-dependent helicase/DNAse subunit B
MSEQLKLSVSKSKSFEQCPAQYKFNYILQIPQKERDFFTFGKFIHFVLEWFHQQYIDGCLLPYHITLNDAFKVAWKKYGIKMTKEMKEECWSILHQYLQLISKDKSNGRPFNIIAVEKEFNFPLSEDVLLRGYIDVVKLDEDGVLHVADWKSSKNKKYMTDFTQLLTYAFILLSTDPGLTKIRGSYVMMRHGFEYLTREFGIEEILAMKQKYLDYAEKIRNEKDFIATPNNLCGWCSYLDICEPGRSSVAGSFHNQDKVFGEVNW